MDIETKNTVTNNTGDAASVADQDKNHDTPQWQGLRRVPDKLPMIALLILVVEVRVVTPVPDYNLLTLISAWGKIYLLWTVRPAAKLHQVSPCRYEAHCGAQKLTKTATHMIQNPTSQVLLARDRLWLPPWGTFSSSGRMHPPSLELSSLVIYTRTKK